MMIDGYTQETLAKCRWVLFVRHKVTEGLVKLAICIEHFSSRTSSCYGCKPCAKTFDLFNLRVCGTLVTGLTHSYL